MVVDADAGLEAEGLAEPGVGQVDVDHVVGARRQDVEHVAVGVEARRLPYVRLELELGGRGEIGVVRVQHLLLMMIGEREGRGVSIKKKGDWI